MLPPKFAHLRIRPATNDDCEPVQKLVFGVLAEFGLHADPATTDADLQDIEANYFRRGGLFEVIMDGDSLIGSVALYPIDDGVCELRKMYFVVAARGQGLGRYILQRAIGQARELGFKQMILETSSKLTAANRLYTSFGFKPVESNHLATRADQAYVLDL